MPDPGITELRDLLHRIDGAGYRAYQQLTGTDHDLGPARLRVDHVQGDPFAPPSLARLVVDRDRAALPADLVRDRLGRTAVADSILRAIRRALHPGRTEPPLPGGDAAGALRVTEPGQEVLERTAVVITPDAIEVRLAITLPAAGRRIRGREAARILTQTLPALAERTMLAENLDIPALRDAVRLLRDQEHLRALLPGLGLVAFVPDGAILPRRAGNSDLPLEHGATAFSSPPSLRVSIDLLSGARVTGMGVPEGVTVIVGGGYHGKSTLLRALARGVHPHVAGDGREGVITRADAAVIRAEDGRAVIGVDISPFIADLPSGTDVRAFTTTSASGSTSQAANLMEALEMGATALLIDEDTSATNIMIRDARMRALIPARCEPITPLVDRVRALRVERGVSTVLVTGGSGAFFDVADHVIALDEYVPRDVTEQARRIAADDPGPTGGDPRGTGHRVFPPTAPRIPAAGALRPADAHRPARARGRDSIQLGRELIDLGARAQLVDAEQTEAIAHALARLADLLDGRADLPAAIAQLDRIIEEGGIDALSRHRGHPGNLARPRPLEIAAAVNRYRALRLEPTR